MADFHFLNPYWLLLLLPLFGLIGWIYRQKKSNSAWQQVIEPQLLQHLLVEPLNPSRNWPLAVAAITGLLAILALANPVWEKQPQTVLQTPRAMVLVLDLSASMNASDLKPTRLVRARLKVQDILKREQEGLTGLVVFAGDAFSVTPLTRDNETISSQLRVLEPGIMPAQGSRLDLGLVKAGELLQQAGIHAGDILLITDGFDSAQAVLEAKKLHQQGHRISVLGIGTTQGAPISDGKGDVFRDKNDVPILAKLDEERLTQLTQIGGGRYSSIRLDESDLDYLLGLPSLNFDQAMDESLFEQNQWKQNGPYLTLLLLPLAALAFRRGWLLSVLLVISVFPVPQPAMAFSIDEMWKDLWQTREQRASEALLQQRHEDTASLSSDPARLGSAFYKQKKYTEALQHFEQLQDSDADYNRGNALARLGKYQEAIDAYDKALQQQPGMQDAIENKAAVEALLKQMQQQAQNQQQQEEDSDNKDDAESEQSETGQQQDNPQQQQQAESSEQQQGTEKQDSQQQADGAGQQAASEPQNQDQNQQDESTSQQPENSNQTPGQPSDNQFADAAEAMDKDGSEDPQKPEAKPETKQEAEPRSAQQQESSSNQQPQQAQADQQASELSSEEQLAAEQWLRRIPDDPGGLLKRKFLYQYQQRNQKPSSRQPW